MSPSLWQKCIEGNLPELLFLDGSAKDCSVRAKTQRVINRHNFEFSLSLRLPAQSTTASPRQITCAVLWFVLVVEVTNHPMCLCQVEPPLSAEQRWLLLM